MDPVSQRREFLGARLTSVEISVLARVASGRNHHQAAADLHISYSNVVQRCWHIRAKLGCNSMAQAALVGHREGYLHAPTGPDNAVYPVLSAVEA